MEGQRFDALARRFAAPTRREVLRALAGAAAGGLLTLLGVNGADAAAKPKPPKPPQVPPVVQGYPRALRDGLL